MSIKCSVIIPTRNRVGTLPAAIDSVITQDCPGVLEVILVDDASDSQAARDLHQSLVDEHESLKLIRHSVQQGAAGARNSGIQAACGQYLAFLDDDDRWEAGVLREALTVLDASNGAYDFTAMSLCRVARDGQTTRFRWPTLDDDQTIDKAAVIDSCVVFLQTLVVASSVAKRAGPLRTDLKVLEDYEWALRMLASARGRYIDRVAVMSPVSADSLSEDYGLRAAALATLLRCQRDCLAGHPAAQTLLSYELAKAYGERGQRWAALRQCFALIRRRPTYVKAYFALLPLLAGKNTVRFLRRKRLVRRFFRAP